MNWMDQMGIRPELQKEVAHFRERFDKDTAPSSVRDAADIPRFHYLGKDIMEKAICALLCEKNLLLAGPKATGKNVLAENLAWIFGRPCWNVSFHVNVDASYLIGTHDFTSFCGNKKMKKSAVRTIYEINFTKKGNDLWIDYRGNGFLQNMVRILTGTLIEVGDGRRAPEELPQILESKKRENAGYTAPACGLMLMEVHY